MKEKQKFGIQYRTVHKEENDDVKLEGIMKAFEKKRIENDSFG